MDKVKLKKLKDLIFFGKYKGRTIELVLELDPDYLIWAHTTIEWFKLEDKIYKDALVQSTARLGRHIRYANYWDDDYTGYMYD